MITLALVGGLITGVSSCVLPMLAIIFFAGSFTSGPTAADTPPGDVQVLAAIVVAGATGTVGLKTVVLTVSFALGAA